MKKMILMWLLLAVGIVMLCAGCSSMSQTAQKISDDLGDKALQAHAFVDIWKVETSDATANGSPTGKKITVIGDVKSIPLTSRDGAIVKDYAEYRKTETPAWYNSGNVTKEEVIICTGDNAAELGKLLKSKLTETAASTATAATSTDTAVK